MNEFIKGVRALAFTVGLLQFLEKNYPEILVEYYKEWEKLDNA